MIVDSMTHAEVYRELDKDRENVTEWWLKKRGMLTKIAKWSTKLPLWTWYEYTSPRMNRYLVLNVILGRKYEDDSMTGVIALRKMERGYAIYVSCFPWQRQTAGKQVFLPHLFDQYHKRGNVKKTGIELIKHFMEHNNHGELSRNDKFFGRSVRYKGRDNLAKSVNDGVVLGEIADGIFVAHTFITYEMATGLQREEFEKNKDLILSEEEILELNKRQDREDCQKAWQKAIAEVMRENETTRYV